MDAEFINLEEKLNLLIRLCADLRADNRALRQQILVHEQENAILTQKVEGAKERIAALLASLPEEESA